MLCGTGGAVPSGKVKEAELCRAEGEGSSALWCFAEWDGKGSGAVWWRWCYAEWEGEGSGAVCCRGCYAEWGGEGSGAGGGDVSSGKVKEAVLCGAGSAVPSGKVKEAVLRGAGGCYAEWEGEGSGAVWCRWCRAEWGRGRKRCCVVQVVLCGVGKGKEGVLVGVGGGGICKSAVGSERLIIVCQLPGTNRQ